MRNIDTLGIAAVLVTLSGAATAGVPNVGFSRDIDIGTLTSTPYVTSFTDATNILLHSYTFDLATPATVHAWLENPRFETGNPFTGIPPVTITIYDTNIFDSKDRLLFAGTTTESWSFGSTMRHHVTGILPAGDNYYVRITGTQLYDSALTYGVELVALPVPELETWGMMLTGLGLLGWRIRKTRS